MVQYQGVSLLFRKLALVFSLVLIFVIGWYALSRLLSPIYAINSYQLALGSKQLAKTSASQLLVASYNIAHARGGALGASNWQGGRTEAVLYRHLDNLAKHIKQSKADIVVLNEIDFTAAWSLHINQARYLAQKAGFQYVVEQRNMDDSIPFYHFKFGNAILSRYLIENSQLIKFPHVSSLENIFVGSHDGVISDIHTDFGSIGLVAVHLEYRSEKVRVASVKQISALTKEYHLPVIAAGDFNAAPTHFAKASQTVMSENALDYLIGKGGFRASAEIKDEAAYHTFPSEAPTAVIDWIVGSQGVEVANAKVLRSPLSDHNMIIAEIHVNDTNIRD